MDKHPLDMKIITKHENGEILEALLTCPECNRYYPVISGIPIMTPDEFRERAIEAPSLKRWSRFLEESGEGPLLPDAKEYG